MGSGCVAQLIERLLPIAEVHSSNPVIGKKIFILNICLLSTVYWKGENKEKEAEDGLFLKMLLPANCGQCYKTFREEIKISPKLSNWKKFVLNLH